MTKSIEIDEREIDLCRHGLGESIDEIWQGMSTGDNVEYKDLNHPSHDPLWWSAQYSMLVYLHFASGGDYEIISGNYEPATDPDSKYDYGDDAYFAEYGCKAEEFPMSALDWASKAEYWLDQARSLGATTHDLGSGPSTPLQRVFEAVAYAAECAVLLTKLSIL